jgi:hypothetical protein
MKGLLLRIDGKQDSLVEGLVRLFNINTIRVEETA